MRSACHDRSARGLRQGLAGHGRRHGHRACWQRQWRAIQEGPIARAFPQQPSLHRLAFLPLRAFVASFGFLSTMNRSSSSTAVKSTSKVGQGGALGDPLPSRDVRLAHVVCMSMIFVERHSTSTIPSPMNVHWPGYICHGIPMPSLTAWLSTMLTFNQTRIFVLAFVCAPQQGPQPRALLPCSCPLPSSPPGVPAAPLSLHTRINVTGV